MGESRYGVEFDNVTQCDDADQKVLESLRFRDQDACLKGGAVLAFAALILACVLVVMAAPPDAQIYVGRGEWAYGVLVAAFWAGLLTALMAFYAITKREKEYHPDPFQANLDYLKIIRIKNIWVDGSVWGAAVAALLLVGGSTAALF